MDIENLEQRLRTLVQAGSSNDFIFELLLAYTLPKASITRLKNGDYNRSRVPGEVLWKGRAFFKHSQDDPDLHSAIDGYVTDTVVTRHKPRFVIVTDFSTFLAVDTKTKDSLDIPFLDLPGFCEFFLPWAGLEKAKFRAENPADMKAAEKVGKLYDLLMVERLSETDDERHALNVFLSRLLFCFFAEDTGIFSKGRFTDAIASHTSADGRDLHSYLERLFRVLDSEDRSGFSDFLRGFPYVGGGLFTAQLAVPRFSTAGRNVVLECGALNWQAINPDILGSMIQAVVRTGERASLGVHYTSVANINKVLEPLFLDSVRVELEAAGKSKKKLRKLLERIYGLRMFDPACGSGNFLVIAYKALCALEIEVLTRIHGNQKLLRFENNIATTQFHGIEVDEFAHQTARLSLWIAQHQMNLEFEGVFGTTRPTLPLDEGGKITHGNATRLDWREVCPVNSGEVYVLGNPPYKGARTQSDANKGDMAHVFDGHEDFKNCDYVCCWFLLAADYIRGADADFAFLTTNSIAQGEQVALLWSRVLGDLEIGFAYQSFRWSNSAKYNAGVSCVVAGVRTKSSELKVLYSGEGARRKVKNISPYLREGTDTMVRRSKRSLSGMPNLAWGNQPRDGGNLLMTTVEADGLVAEFPQATPLVRRYMGATEFLNSSPRACLWITDDDLSLANSIPPIADRIRRTREFRLASSGASTRGYARTPHMLAQRPHQPGNSLIIPGLTSELREYSPIGFLDDSTVISNLAFAVYGAGVELFGVLSSRMHNVWVRGVGGRLETRLRYSKELCYNPFPFPEHGPKRGDGLARSALEVLGQRERWSELTLKQLYEPTKMPRSLREAHQELDRVVESSYRAKSFQDDDERLAFLLTLYEHLVEAQATQES